MFSRFLNHKTKTVTFAALLLGGASLLSKILALLRDNLLANLLPKVEADIYFAAFRIPDLVYGILITGGIVAAFLPVFSSQLKESKEKARNLINNVLTFFLIALASVSLILAIFTPQLVRLIVPGFTPDQQALTVVLTRILFLSPILLGLSAIFSGILQYYNLFFVYALAPILYNLGIIFGILFFRPWLGLVGLAWGVIMGAAFHLFLQVPPAIKCGFLPRLSFNFNHPGLKRIFYLMLPRVLSSAAFQINLIVITAIASTLRTGAIRVFNFANNLQGVPVSLIGISFATAAFPVLSRNFAEVKKKNFFKNFTATFNQILFLIVPLSVLIFLLRAQIVRIVLGTSFLNGGLFDWWDTRLTAACLGIFSGAIFASCLVPFLARVFFASGNTRTPVKIALASMGLNIFLAFLFVHFLSFSNSFQKYTAGFLKLEGVKDISVVGLSAALSLALIFQFFLLIYFLKKNFSGLRFDRIFQSLAKILLSAVLMGIFIYLTLQLTALFLNTTRTTHVLSQVLMAMAAGGVVYFILVRLLKCKELKTIWHSILAQFKK